MQLGGLGSAVSSPVRSGAEPQLKLILVHVSVKIWHNNFDDFPEKQLTKFCAVKANLDQNHCQGGYGVRRGLPFGVRSTSMEFATNNITQICYKLQHGGGTQVHSNKNRFVRLFLTYFFFLHSFSLQLCLKKFKRRGTWKELPPRA